MLPFNWVRRPKNIIYELPKSRIYHASSKGIFCVSTGQIDNVSCSETFR